MSRRLRLLTARVVASVSLVAIALWFAPQPLLGAAVDPIDCAAHHTLPSRTAFDATTPGACDIGSMDWCSLMPGCSASAPALVVVSRSVPTVPLPALASPCATPSERGLLALGPPTPPPIG